MEGITTSVFRRVHHSLFPGTKYYSPFIAPDTAGSFKPKYLRELTSDTNSGVKLIPQLLVNNAYSFCVVTEKLRDLGFDEVNLNLGCPSGTVFAKHKGAALLSDPDSLRQLLDGIFSGSKLPVSIKTRMGVSSTSEFPDILKIYNSYPIRELIIHARDRAGLYRSVPDITGFSEALLTAKMPVTYNGNIFSQADEDAVLAQAPQLNSVMLGRGALADPALIRRLCGGKVLSSEELKEFLCRLFEEYSAVLSPNYVVDRMKGLWYYMRALFPDDEKLIRQLLKAKNVSDYTLQCKILFEYGNFDPDGVKNGASMFC